MDAIMQPMFYFPFLENKEGNRYEPCPHLASNFFGAKQTQREKKICFIGLYKPPQSFDSPSEYLRVLGWLNISSWPRRTENPEIFNQQTKQDCSDSLTDDLNPWCHQSLWFVVFKPKEEKKTLPAEILTTLAEFIHKVAQCPADAP